MTSPHPPDDRTHAAGENRSVLQSDEWRWRLAIQILPLAAAVLLLGRVWTHLHDVIGTDQFLTERIIDNAGPFLIAPGSAPWAWPATAPACLDDHVLGQALLMLPWRLLGIGYMPALWLTTAISLALSGTLLAVLLRRWGLAPLATITAAVLVVGLPVFVQRLQHTNNLESCWILAWIIAVDRWCERQDRARTVLLALAGLSIAIMPATVLQWSGLTVPVLVLIVLVRHRPTARTLLLAIATHIPGLLLALWIYHPYAANGHAPNVIIPSPWQDLFQPLGTVAWAADGQHSDSLCTPGPVPIIGVIGLMAVLFSGKISRNRRLAAALILAAIVVNLLCAVSIGSWSAVDRLRGLPLFSGMRSPARFAIPACVLAVGGCAWLIDIIAEKQKNVAIGLALAVLVAQMFCDGGAVAPLRLFTHTTLPVADISAACRPGPLLALPTGILDDRLGLATGRVTVGTAMGRPTDWQVQLATGDVDTVARTLLALQRLGLAAVVTDDDQVGPVLADILRHLGAQPHPTAAPNLTWWELPPVPPGDWQSAAVLTRISVIPPGADPQHGTPAPGWSLAITGDPGAAPVACRVTCGSFSTLLEQFLPGTHPVELAFPGADQPRLTWSRPIPLRVDAAGP